MASMVCGSSMLEDRYTIGAAPAVIYHMPGRDRAVLSRLYHQRARLNATFARRDGTHPRRNLCSAFSLESYHQESRGRPPATTNMLKAWYTKGSIAKGHLSCERT